MPVRIVHKPVRVDIALERCASMVGRQRSTPVATPSCPQSRARSAGVRGSACRCDSLWTCLSGCDARASLTGAMHSMRRCETMRLRIVHSRRFATVVGTTQPRRFQKGRVCELSEQLSTSPPQSLRTHKKGLENAGFAGCARALMTRLVHKPDGPHPCWCGLARSVGVERFIAISADTCPSLS